MLYEVDNAGSLGIPFVRRSVLSASGGLVHGTRGLDRDSRSPLATFRSSRISTFLKQQHEHAANVGDCPIELVMCRDGSERGKNVLRDKEKWTDSLGLHGSRWTRN